VKTAAISKSLIQFGSLRSQTQVLQGGRSKYIAGYRNPQEVSLFERRELILIPTPEHPA